MENEGDLELKIQVLILLKRYIKILINLRLSISQVKGSKGITLKRKGIEGNKEFINPIGGKK